jgi:hypothetical protein
MILIMKKSLMFIALSVSTCLSGQKLPVDSVPESVRPAFKKLYSDARVRPWESERYGLYEAEFMWKNSRTSVTFNANGLLMRTEEEVRVKDIPPAIIRHAKKLYPDHKVRECANITTPDRKHRYEVEIVKGKDRKSLIFSENNEYLREEVDEDDDDAGRN